jgi:uncharacterized membrane protein YphA (DoxX/SURF4 family)
VFSDLRSSLRLAFRADDPFLSAPQPTWLYPRWTYLRMLGVGFASSFLSLSTQVTGLIGEHGILPARELLQRSTGWRDFLAHPSLFHIDASDATLRTACLVGFVLAASLVLGLWPRVTLALSAISYASFVTVSQEFSGFQSEGLLIEMALVGMYLAPRGFRPGLGERSPPSRTLIWLVRFLCFRLWLEAGIAKLSSTDPSWRELRALDAYYENAPFPTWVGWWIQHLPQPFHAFTAFATLFIECLGPVGLLLGGKWRRVAVLLWTLLHVFVLLTANYTFLNYSALALGFTFLDDSDFRRVFPIPKAQLPASPPIRRRWLVALLAFPLVVSTYGSFLLMLLTFGFPVGALPRGVLAPLFVARSFRVSNRFALFAGMTQKREQIEIEGTNDGGATWHTYPFRWQPQALDEPPHFMAPHLPRFDWNLWFASNSTWQAYPLVRQSGLRLMQGSSSVSALFAKDPFVGRPPEIVRFPLYRYRFTSVSELRETGNYWTRERIGYYAPLLYRDQNGDIVSSEIAE